MLALLDLCLKKCFNWSGLHKWMWITSNVCMIENQSYIKSKFTDMARSRHISKFAK